MPKITVLTTSYRDIYRDLQATALARQSFDDFEWVFVDDLYESMRYKMVELTKGKIKLIHIPPEETSPFFAKASALNDGLVHSSGKIVYFMNDYVVPHRDCLKRHWEMQGRYGGVMLSGHAVTVEAADLDLLDKPVRAGSDGRMGLFDEDIFPKGVLETGVYECFRHGVQNWFNGRNDSCPIKPLIECNGFDEQFDGAWGGEDADMAQRLMTYGMRFILDKYSKCIEFPHVSGGKPSNRLPQEQRDMQILIDRRVKEGIYQANPHKDIREERKKCLNLSALES